MLDVRRNERTGRRMAMRENSVKRSDVTRWKQGYITPPPPYFILWKAVTSLCENKAPPPYFIVSASWVKTMEVKVIVFHRIESMQAG